MKAAIKVILTLIAIVLVPYYFGMLVVFVVCEDGSNMPLWITGSLSGFLLIVCGGAIVTGIMGLYNFYSEDKPEKEAKVEEITKKPTYPTLIK